MHVVAGCQSYLNRFTRRHDSALNFLAQTLQSINTCKLYADLSFFKNPSIITGVPVTPAVTNGEDGKISTTSKNKSTEKENNLKGKPSKM